MDESIILVKLALEELQELGYKEAWIGSVESPHWPRHGNGQFVIAAPPCRKSGWPSMWSASEKVFGKIACGNGLKEADQCQRGNVRKMRPGHYKFEKELWTIVQTNK
jgi:hypothetical protein